MFPVLHSIGFLCFGFLLLDDCSVFAGNSRARLIGVYLVFSGFHSGASTWCVSGVPCYSRSLVFWNFSGALFLLTIVWPDVKVRRPIRLPPSSFRRPDVAGPAVSQSRKRRRDKYHFSNDNSSFISLFCSWIVVYSFDQSTLHTSKILVCSSSSDIYLRVKIVSSRLNIIFLILVSRFPGILLDTVT